MKALFASLILLFAAEEGARLDGPEQEARAQDLMREIRCVACENEPISNSGSDIAADMRERVRAMVAEGKTDEEVRDWFAERYGEFVLFRPRSDGIAGLLLWGGPFLLLIAGLGLVYVLRRRGEKRRQSVEPLPPEEAGSP